MKKCYRCDAEGTTKEHVPPDSFFPKGYRAGLITVPSCPDHNTKNSKDVEYVRNIIVSHISTNDVARSHFQDKVRRSFENTPKLFYRTFKDAKPFMVAGQETALFAFDLDRLKNVMEAIAYAIYFKSFAKSYAGRWEIFGTNLVSEKNVFQNQADGWYECRQLLRQLRYAELAIPQPEVFRCGIHQWNEEQLVYLFLFYGGFTFHAIAVPPAHDAV